MKHKTFQTVSLLVSLLVVLTALGTYYRFSYSLTNNAHINLPIAFKKACGLFENEPNDKFSQADGPILVLTEFQGCFQEATDKNDVFFFDVEVESAIQIYLTNISLGQDYDLSLFNSQHDTVKFSVNRNNADEEILVTDLMPVGRYYIQVYNASALASTRSYKLLLKHSVLPTPTPTPLPQEPRLPQNYETFDDFDKDSPLTEMWEIKHSTTFTCDTLKQNGYLRIDCQGQDEQDRARVSLEPDFPPKFRGVAIAGQVLTYDAESTLELTLNFDNKDGETIYYHLTLRGSDLRVRESFPVGNGWQSNTLARQNISPFDKTIVLQIEYQPPSTLLFYIDEKQIFLDRNPEIIPSPTLDYWQIEAESYPDGKGADHLESNVYWAAFLPPATSTPTSLQTLSTNQTRP